MNWDKTKNFAISTLDGAINNSVTSLDVQSGDAAAKFPANVEFNCVIWKKSAYAEPQDDPNMEIVRVTNIATDTFTITRGQEGSSPAAHEDGDRIELNITAKVLDDIIANKLGNSADVIKDDHIDWGVGAGQVNQDDVVDGATYVQTTNDFSDTYKGYLDQGVKQADSPTFAGLALGAGSITMSGSIGVTGTRVTKGWFTDLEITNTPTVNGTSLASIYAAVAQTMYIGTTQVAINRASAALTLAGITLTTPDIGVATATSINKITITQPANSGVLTIQEGFTLTCTGNASVSGTNTGDNTVCTSGTATTAVTLATTRAIYGNNFDGSAALTQVIASTYGGTGNGFTKFTGPTTAEKTFTLPDASATLLYSGGDAGTPSALVGTNISGTASGLTAGKATILETARTIAGQSFDGSANITIASTNLSDTTTVGGNLVSLTNPSAISFIKIAADNTISTRTPANVMADLSGAAGAAFSMNTQKITGVVDPTEDQEAATKKYVDDNAGGSTDYFSSYLNFYTFDALDGWNEAKVGAGSILLRGGGKINFTTAAANGDKCSISQKQISDNIQLTGKAVTVEWNVCRVTQTTSQTIFVVFMFGSTFPPTASNYYFGYKIIDNDLSATNASGGTETATDTSLAAPTTTGFHRYKAIFVPGTDIKYYVDDVLKATHTTNLPATADGGILLGIQTNTTAERYLQVNRCLVEKVY